MGRLALASALKDFGAEAGGLARSGPPPAAVAFPDLAPEPIFAMPVPQDTAEAQAERIAAAVAESEAALTERLRAEHEAALAAERERHAAEMASLGEQLSGEAVTQLAGRIAEMEERVVELVSSATARMLGASLTEEMTRRSLDRLAQTILEAVRDDDAIRIRVSGPQSLFGGLKAALPGRAKQMEFAESATVDLTVTIADSVLETRMAEWSAALSEVLS